MVRTNPHVFTEEGVAMLSSVLKTEIACTMSIKIIRAFVYIRKYILNDNKNNILINHEERILKLEETLNEFKEKNNHIFFEGQIYDAYSLLIEILNKSKEEIIIIDNYIDKSLLDILSKTNKKITIITNKYNNNDYNKYKEQYNNVSLVINNNFHDRFIIIDKNILYHCGASFKDLGNKCFEISKIEDKEILEDIIKRV